MLSPFSRVGTCAGHVTSQLFLEHITDPTLHCERNVLGVAGGISSA
jgi:hypothetical protein